MHQLFHTQFTAPSVFAELPSAAASTRSPSTPWLQQLARLKARWPSCGTFALVLAVLLICCCIQQVAQVTLVAELDLDHPTLLVRRAVHLQQRWKEQQEWHRLAVWTTTNACLQQVLRCLVPDCCKPSEHVQTMLFPPSSVLLRVKSSSPWVILLRYQLDADPRSSSSAGVLLGVYTLDHNLRC